MTPITCHTHEVKDIIAGRQTMLRRTVKFPKDFDGKSIYLNGSLGLKYSSNEFEGCIHRLFPKYEIGDVLWVKETWVYGCLLDENEHIQDARYYYRADKDWADIEWYCGYKEYPQSSPRWRSSTHMPRTAARLFLKITGIRVESIGDGYEWVYEFEKQKLNDT